MPPTKPMKWNNLEFDDEQGNKIMIRQKGHDAQGEIIEMHKPGGGWVRLLPTAAPVNKTDEFAYYSGSRWVYINGKWYKI